MAVCVVRHGLSEANNRHNVGTLAFAHGDAPLMELSTQQAEQAGSLLTQEHGRSMDEPVATSKLLRTQQTAQKAGFVSLRSYAILNEVDHGIDLRVLRDMLDHNELPERAVAHAERLLETPPPEKIWFTHGLVIAGLCRVLDIQYERAVPRFCEIRTLPIETY